MFILLMNNIIAVAHVTCFKNNRIIYKYFFTVIEENHQVFNDVSQLFWDHVSINLDSKLSILPSLTN